MLHEFVGVKVWPQPFETWWYVRPAGVTWLREHAMYAFSSLIVTR